jgi:predicted dehydrogenase
MDPEIDVIYIATPHALHYVNTLLCLLHGKAVLCEKAFAINHAQASEMVRMSREKKIFLMEALWTRFLPHFEEVMARIREGKLGSVRSVLANFGFKPRHPVADRIYNLSLGGGSLLDIGIYNVFLALSVLGRPDRIEAWMTPAPTGADEQCAATFLYENGAMAQLFSTFSSNLATDADISGDKARIRLTSRFHEPSTSIEFYPDRAGNHMVIPFTKEPGWGYQYEVMHVHQCLRLGLTESPAWSLTDTLLLMETLDRIREKAGIRYLEDGNP